MRLVVGVGCFVLSVKGVRKFGRSFRDVAIVVGTRSLDQVKKHARAEQVKEHALQHAKQKPWDKEEHERFLKVRMSSACSATLYVPVGRGGQASYG